MAIPDYQSIMGPLLRLVADQREHRIRDLYEAIAHKFSLSEDERLQLLPSGKAPVINNRVQWAKSCLLKAALIESPQRGLLRITERGLRLLARDPDSIDNETLKQYPEFVAFFHSASNTESRKRRPKLDSCYLAASLNADTSCLRSLLEHRHVEWTDVARATPGATVLDTIAREIERTTFVCSVVPDSEAIANALFELGMAFGKGKPLFIIVDPQVKLPRELGPAHLVRARPSDRAAISFHLDAFLGHIGLHRRPPATTTPARKEEIIVQDILQDLISLEPRSAKQRGYQLESIVAEIFARAGAEVVNVSNDPHAYADLSMWLDDLSPTLGNPILVEIKWGKLSYGRLAQADDRLFRALHVTDAKAAVLVYWDEDGKTFRRRRRDTSLIFWFSLHDLIQTVERGDFAREIIARRNRAVHGSG